jgi:hypothetical protein
MTKVEIVPRSRDCVPQGQGFDELKAIRTLLRLGRPKEALERLDIWLDRNVHEWRIGSHDERVRWAS